jgi:hypothetical protein
VTLGGAGNGFEFTVPADTVSRGLKVYLGLSQAGGKLEATLSDGSATPIVDTSLVNNVGTSNYVYSLNFRAASNGQTLTVRWTANSVVGGSSFVSLQAATLGDLYECDVAPRSLGNRNGSLTNADVIQVRRFLAGLDTANLNNEFQRADCAGLPARGSNTITNADVIQARRFLAGLDVIPTAAGPSPSGLHSSLVNGISVSGENLVPAADDLSVYQASISGNQLTVGVKYASPGDAVGIGFTLTWNPAHLTLTNPGSNVILGNGAAGFLTLGTLNTTQLASGRLGVPMDPVSLTTPLPAGLRPILAVQFTINNPGSPTETLIDFGDNPIVREITTVLNDIRTPDTTGSMVSLVAPTAASVSVSGRIADNLGRGISRVLVTVNHATGERKTTHTNTFGYYRFDDIRAGATYTVSAMSRRYTLDPPTRVISVVEDVVDLDFQAREALAIQQPRSLLTAASLAPDDLTVSRVSLIGNKLQVAVNYQSQGDAVGAGFSLTWDPLVLSNPANIVAGSGAAPWTLGLPNTTQVSLGRLGIPMDGPLGSPLPSGSRQIVALEFDVVASPPSSTIMSFGDSPIAREINLSTGEFRTPNTFPATISLLNPTAAGVTVSGRVADSSGLGIGRVLVTMSNAAGERKTAFTNTFGYYRFDDVRAGAAYTVSAMSKRYTFDPPVRVISVFDDVTDLDFLGSD